MDSSMFKIEITSKEDFRSFTKGYKVTFDFDDIDTIYLMGKNGCGKSTIMQALRGALNSNMDADSKWNAKSVCKDLEDKFDIDITGFNKIYHLDVDGLDDMHSLFNSASCDDFIQNGGYRTQKYSTGERTLYQLAKMKEYINQDDDSVLLVFDEVDNHLDYEFALKFPRWCNNTFPKAKKLIITHNILSAVINDGDIVDIVSRRTAENNLNHRVTSDLPIIWKNDVKDAFFSLNTNLTLNPLVEK